jgi:hypothetical protein
MSKGDPITYEELAPEHKQKFDEIKALFEVDLIGSFERTRHHGIRWKSAPVLCIEKSTIW